MKNNDNQRKISGCEVFFFLIDSWNYNWLDWKLNEHRINLR